MTDIQPIDISSKSIALKNGLILGVALTIHAFMLEFFKVDDADISSMASQLLTVLVTVTALRTYRNQNEGFLSLGKCLKLSAGLNAIAAVLLVIYLLIYLTNYDTEAIPNQLKLLQ